MASAECPAQLMTSSNSQLKHRYGAGGRAELSVTGGAAERPAAML